MRSSFLCICCLSFLSSSTDTKLFFFPRQVAALRIRSLIIKKRGIFVSSLSRQTATTTSPRFNITCQATTISLRFLGQLVRGQEQRRVRISPYCLPAVPPFNHSWSQLLAYCFLSFPWPFHTAYLASLNAHFSYMLNCVVTQPILDP